MPFPADNTKNKLKKRFFGGKKDYYMKNKKLNRTEKQFWIWYINHGQPGWTKQLPTEE